MKYKKVNSFPEILTKHYINDFTNYFLLIKVYNMFMNTYMSRMFL